VRGIKTMFRADGLVAPAAASATAPKP
jgi:alanine-synthesizing transaminase